MPRKKTKEMFVSDAIKAHGHKYDYSKVNYVNNHTKVCIICQEHGEFWQLPKDHIKGKGCMKCWRERELKCSLNGGTKGLVYGVGINDVPNSSSTEYYKKWICMLNRCYHPTQLARNHNYDSCTVCDEWLKLSNFKLWFEDKNNGYIKGHQIDKDLFGDVVKIYSQKTCCFLPIRLNCILDKNINKKVYIGLPHGVIQVKYKKNITYRADISTKSNKRETIGYFKSAKDAYNVYKNKKEKQIRDIARYFFLRCEITERVYNKLLNYKLKEYDENINV